MDLSTVPRLRNETRYAEDSALVERICGLDRHAVEQFYSRFHKLIYHVIQGFGEFENQDHEDLFNSFFIYLSENKYRRITRWNGNSLLSTYIVTVLKNFLIDFQRSRKSRPLSGDKPLEELSDNIFDNSGSPDITEEIYTNQLRKFTKDSKRFLKKRDRDIICKRHYQNQSPTEIADGMGVSMNAYYAAASRAETKLIQIIKNKYPELFSGNM